MSTQNSSPEELPQLREELMRIRGEVRQIDDRLFKLQVAIDRATRASAVPPPSVVSPTLPPAVAIPQNISIQPTPSPPVPVVEAHIPTVEAKAADTVPTAKSGEFDLFPAIELKLDLDAPATNISHTGMRSPIVHTPPSAAPRTSAWAARQAEREKTKLATASVADASPSSDVQTAAVAPAPQPAYLSAEFAPAPATAHRLKSKANAAGATIAAIKKIAAPKEIDWEALIGGRWMTWVGAFTLLLAVGFGIHWAWTTLHTPPWVHVLAFHLLGGGFLAGAAFVYRKGMPLAAKSLVGLGIFTLYAAAFAALRLYGLWPETMAFIEFAGITVIAIALALRANSAAVILLGALGGYLTPILTSSGSANYIGLFTYLAFLNVALVGCAVLRGWSFLKPLALAATAIMFGGWVFSSHFDGSLSGMVWGTEWFAVLHFAIFLIGSTLPPVAWKRPSHWTDLAALTASSLLFTTITWFLFRDWPNQQLALVSWGLSALHAVLFGITFSRVTNVDRMPRIHLALAALFFTLAIPLQLNNGAYWGATWCVEALVFTAVGVYFRDRQMATSAAIVLLVAAVRLVGWDWHSPPQLVHGTQLDLRCAMFFVSGLMAMLCGGMYRLIPWAFSHREQSDLQPEQIGKPAAALDPTAPVILSAIGAILFTLAPLLQFENWVYVGPIWAVEALAFTMLGLLWNDEQMRLTGLLVMALAAGRLVGFDFMSPAQTFGRSALDTRFLALAVSGVMAMLAGGLYRFLPWALGRQPSKSEIDLSATRLLSLAGAVFITLCPMMQLSDWVYLGPIWAVEALAFTLLGLIWNDVQMRLTGVTVMALAASRLIGFDFRSPAQTFGSSALDTRFLALAISGVVAMLAGGLHRFLPWTQGRESSKSELDLSVTQLLSLAGVVFITLCPMMQLSDWVYLGPVWAVEALVFTLLGLALRERQMKITALAVFTLAACRLIGFDFFTPARTWGNSQFDLRAAAFLVAGSLALFCGAIYRVVLRRRGISLSLTAAEFASGDFSKIDSAGVVALVPSFLLALGALLITFSPPLQLADLSLLAPIWAVEALVFTIVGICLADQPLTLIGGTIFCVAAGRLLPFDFRSAPKLIPGTMWDFRFVAMEATGSISIVAGALYWMIPRLLRRRSGISDVDRIFGGVLLAAGNLAMMLGLTCQWDTRLVLVAWTLDAAAILAAGFYFDQQLVRWYAIVLALAMVGGRALFSGDKLDGTYHLIANSRFGSLALVSAFYFAAGAMYRSRMAGRPKIDLSAADWTKLSTREMLQHNEAGLDPLFGVLANFVLLGAISLEIHSWFAAAIAAGSAPFADMHMAEMASYSIVWAVYAAIMVAVGFALHYKLFRIIGLVAFGPILLKVFFVDLENLQLLPRAMAFAVLGTMLLGVSMLYQKFFVRVDKKAEAQRVG